MIHLLAFCLCTALAITGLHVAITRPGMLLNGIERTCHKINMPPYLTKPLFDCPICMSSCWTLISWLTTGHTLNPRLLLAILTVAGINTIICTLLDSLSEYGC